MKIKSVESIVKSNRNIQIKVGPEGVQWLGDGSAFYPLHGFPVLGEETIFRFFDIPEDKQGKYTYTEGEFPEWADLEDFSKSDRMLERSEIRILASGMKLLPLFTGNRVYFIDERYLTPFSDEENGVELYERRWSTSIVIAVKIGFLLAGIIAPVRMESDKLMEIVKRMVDEDV